MTDDFQALEAALAGLRPAALDRRLLARLEGCAAGDSAALSPTEAQFEAALRNIQPAPLPPAWLAALEATLIQDAATEASRIVPFPQIPAATRHHPMLAAAAAVALFGAAAAWFIPATGTHPAASAPTSQPPPAQPFAPAPAAPANQNFVPAAFHTGLSQASDVGVLWPAQNQAQRVVKVVYWDRFTLVNPEGKQIEYEKPRVEYILVPEKID